MTQQGFRRYLGNYDWADDVNPWLHAPEEAGVEWDRDVAPLLEGMPEKTTIYWDAKMIGGYLYLSVTFSVTINRYTIQKSVLWTKPYPGWKGGWMSNFGRPTVAAELDWTDHPGLLRASPVAPAPHLSPEHHTATSESAAKSLDSRPEESGTRGA